MGKNTEMTPKRLYLVPVRDACNYDCTFCFMKEKEQESSKPQFLNIKNFEDILKNKLQINNDINEVEITGGGEPTLHKNLPTIIKLLKNYFPKSYIKLYTNGELTPLYAQPIDEVNISRVHWDTTISKKFSGVNGPQRSLDDVIGFYRVNAKKVRLQTILLKGAIDSKEEVNKFIQQYESSVDTFMFRTLFSDCNLEQDKFVSYDMFKNITHQKIKLDTTLNTYHRPLYFIGTDCVLHNSFQF